MELISLKLKFYCFARFRAKIRKILKSNLLVFVVGTNVTLAISFIINIYKLIIKLIYAYHIKQCCIIFGGDYSCPDIYNLNFIKLFFHAYVIL